MTRIKTQFFCNLMLVLIYFVFSAQTTSGSLETQVNALKQQSKDALKDARYEGAKVVYYYVGGEKQTKTVELYFLLPSEYKIVINGKKCSVTVNVNLYDAPEENEDRHLIKTIKKINGKETILSLTELNETYRKKVPEVERIKDLFVEYVIDSGKPNKEAIILVTGKE